ncbi:MAG: addiction module antidote protein [Pyrinomonadaceae bacterium]
MRKTQEKRSEDSLTVSYEDYLANSLKDPVKVEAYLNAALEDEDPRVFLLALRDIAKARGINDLAAKANISRESLYRMLSTQGNPVLSSLEAVLRALDLRFAVKHKQSTEDEEFLFASFEEAAESIDKPKFIQPQPTYLKDEWGDTLLWQTNRGIINAEESIAA